MFQAIDIVRNYKDTLNEIIVRGGGEFKFSKILM